MVRVLAWGKCEHGDTRIHGNSSAADVKRYLFLLCPIGPLRCDVGCRKKVSERGAPLPRFVGLCTRRRIKTGFFSQFERPIGTWATGPLKGWAASPAAFLNLLGEAAGWSCS